MQDMLHFFLSDEALTTAQHSGMGAQLLRLLAEQTGSAWHMTGADTAVEMVPPYRSVRAWSEINGSWRAFENVMAARCLRVFIDSAEANSFLGFEGETVTQSEPTGRMESLPALEQPHGIAHLAQRFLAARHAKMNFATHFKVAD